MADEKEWVYTQPINNEAKGNEPIPLNELENMMEIDDEFIQQVIADFDNANPDYAGLLKATII